jgi:prepilin-type N-terminal cleavage/methylation domain-containing protein
VNNDRGFTLVEMLVTVVLLSAILLPLIGYLNQARMISAEAHLEANAMRLAQTQMETLLSLSWRTLQSGSRDEGLETPFEQLRWTVSTEGNPQLKKIEVRVDWRDLRGNEQSFSLVTIRSPR